MFTASRRLGMGQVVGTASIPRSSSVLPVTANSGIPNPGITKTQPCVLPATSTHVHPIQAYLNQLTPRDITKRTDVQWQTRQGTHTIIINMQPGNQRKNYWELTAALRLQVVEACSCSHLMHARVKRAFSALATKPAHLRAS